MTNTTYETKNQEKCEKFKNNIKVVNGLGEKCLDIVFKRFENKLDCNSTNDIKQMVNKKCKDRYIDETNKELCEDGEKIEVTKKNDQKRIRKTIL